MSKLRKIDCLALVLLLSNVTAFGQDDDFSYTGIQGSNHMSVDQMDIDGVYRKKRSQAEKLQRSRKNLERKNEDLVRQKIEDARIREEQKMTNRLQKMFKGQPLQEERPVETLVETRPAAKTQTIVKHVGPVATQAKDLRGFKVIPTVGLMIVDSNNVSFDSSANFGVSFESMIASRFSMGVDFNYGKVDIKDLNSGYFGFFQGGINARQMNYRRMTFGLNAKLFILDKANVRPYLGAGIGYSLDRLRYDNNSNSLNSIYGPGQGINEAYKRNYASWTAKVGAEVYISRNFGLNLELAHSRGFATNNNYSTVFVPTVDQVNLNRLGNQLSDSSFTSINFGIIGSF